MSTAINDNDVDWPTKGRSTSVDAVPADRQQSGSLNC